MVAKRKTKGSVGKTSLPPYPSNTADIASAGLSEAAIVARKVAINCLMGSNYRVERRDSGSRLLPSLRPSAPTNGYTPADALCLRGLTQRLHAAPTAKAVAAGSSWCLS
jgi:hypothetical protein